MPELSTWDLEWNKTLPSAMMAAAMATKGKEEVVPHSPSDVDDVTPLAFKLITLAMLGAPLELMANSM